MQHRQIQAFRNSRPGFGHHAARYRQRLARDQLHQPPAPAQPKQAHRPGPLARAPPESASDPADRDRRRAAHRQHPQRRDRHGQPPSGGPRRIGPLGLLPRPAAALAAVEAWVAPAAPGIPLRSAVVGRQVGPHTPWVRGPRAPPGAQRTRQLPGGRGKRAAGATPAHADRPDQIAHPDELGVPTWAEVAALIDPQKMIRSMIVGRPLARHCFFQKPTPKSRVPSGCPTRTAQPRHS